MTSTTLSRLIAHVGGRHRAIFEELIHYPRTNSLPRPILSIDQNKFDLRSALDYIGKTPDTNVKEDLIQTLNMSLAISNQFRLSAFDSFHICQAIRVYYVSAIYLNGQKAVRKHGLRASTLEISSTD